MIMGGFICFIYSFTDKKNVNCPVDKLVTTQKGITHKNKPFEPQWSIFMALKNSKFAQESIFWTQNFTFPFQLGMVIRVLRIIDFPLISIGTLIIPG